MNKQQLSILERVFTCEIDEGIYGTLGLLQTRSKVAAKLAEDGYLEFIAYTETHSSDMLPMKVEGYRLTHLGRITYCATCEGE